VGHASVTSAVGGLPMTERPSVGGEAAPRARCESMRAIPDSSLVVTTVPRATKKDLIGRGGLMPGDRADWVPADEI
jgi:hypothetical protein